MSLARRAASLVARAFGNPFDKGWKKTATVVAAAPKPPKKRPMPGLLLNKEGEVFRVEGGLPVGSVVMRRELRDRLWAALREFNSILQGEGVDPLSANGGRSVNVVSVDALWKAMPYLLPGSFRGFSDSSGLRELYSWLEQLCDLDL